jgi:hypothetical protein
MRILLIESSPGRGTEVAASLAEAGHEIQRCFDDPADHLCRGALDTHACPLEQHVDVAVVVHGEAVNTPSLYEMAGVCAVRHRVPLVSALSNAGDPFAAVASPARGDVVSAVRHAATEPSDGAADAVRLALADLPALAGYPPVPVHVQREHGRLRLELDLPADIEAAAREAAMTWAVRAARNYDGSIPVIDVVVTPVEI